MQNSLDFTTARFFGAGYDYTRDHVVLTGQLQMVYECMKAGAPCTLAGLESVTGIPQASISAAIRSLRNQFGFVIETKLREGCRGTWEYKITGRNSCAPDKKPSRKKLERHIEILKKELLPYIPAGYEPEEYFRHLLGN
jgi:hypothetical protein